jgi:hypothetical protein
MPFSKLSGLLIIRGGMHLMIEFHSVTVGSNGISLENPTLPNHATEAPDCEGPATEAEEEEFILGLIVRYQEAVGVVDIVLKPVAECAAREPIHDVAGANSLIVIDHLRHIAIPLRDPNRDAHNVCRAWVVILFLVCTIPCAIAAKYQTLHGERSFLQEC